VTLSLKITFGETRAFGVRDVLVYCRDHRCSRSTTIGADLLGDHQHTTATASISATIAMKASASVPDISHMTAAPCALASIRYLK